MPIIPILVLSTIIGIFTWFIIDDPYTDENGDGYLTRRLIEKINERRGR